MRGRSRRSALFAHHDQPALNIADQNIAAGQEGINAPGTGEGGAIRRRIGIEITELYRRIRVGHIQDANAARIVREVELVPDGVAVMVDGQSRPGIDDYSLWARSGW